MGQLPVVAFRGSARKVDLERITSGWPDQGKGEFAAFAARTGHLDRYSTLRHFSR